MIRCIAIDDEPLALTQIMGYINKIPFLELVKGCTSAFDALTILSNNKIDLIFADIHMPDINGMDFVKSLLHRPFVIFTTAHPDYALESYRIDAVDYLLKPFGFNEFVKATNKAKMLHDLSQNILLQEKEIAPLETSTQKHLYIKADYKMIKVDIEKILYIESKSEYVRIYLEDSKPIMSLLSMKLLEEYLPENQFMRVHRSYIINLKKITAVAHNRVIFGKDTYIPIGTNHKERFGAYLEKYYIGKDKHIRL